MCKDSIFTEEQLVLIRDTFGGMCRAHIEKGLLDYAEENWRLLTQSRGNWIGRNMSVLNSSVIIVAVFGLTSAWKIQMKMMLKMSLFRKINGIIRFCHINENI